MFSDKLSAWGKAWCLWSNTFYVYLCIVCRISAFRLNSIILMIKLWRHYSCVTLRVFVLKIRGSAKGFYYIWCQFNFTRVPILLLFNFLQQTFHKWQLWTFLIGDNIISRCRFLKFDSEVNFPENTRIFLGAFLEKVKLWQQEVST